MSENPHDSVETWLKNKNCFISLPEICFKIRSLLEDPLHSRADVAGLIRHDPVLTARLLKLVNSAYYSLPYPITSISDSIGLIGDQYLKELVVTATIIEAFNGIAYKISNFDLKQFWSSSMYCAVLARNLAIVSQDDIKEDMFISGLLLNIGKLPIFYHAPQLMIDLREQQDNEDNHDTQIEQTALGFDHTDIGSALATSWNFSEVLIEAIAKHHHQPKPDDSVAQHISYLANYLKEHLDSFDSEDQEQEQETEFDAEILDMASTIGLSQTLLCSVLETSHRDFTDIYQTFCAA